MKPQYQALVGTAVSVGIMTLPFAALHSAKAAPTDVPTQAPTVTVTISNPGVTKTITITPPAVTNTVKVRVTKTVTVRPTITRRPTKFITRKVTIFPPVHTRTVTKNPVIIKPTKTVTHNIVRNHTVRQTATVRATVTKTPDALVKTRYETRTRTEVIVKRVLLGTLVSLVLAGLGILAMFIGYGLGQKDAERNEDNFLLSLLSRGKHS